jgi:hypothetical protein
MSTLVIKNLTIDQTHERQTMHQISGGGCLYGTVCGPADEPLPELYSPVSVADIFDSNSALKILDQWRMPEIGKDKMIPY